MILRLRILRSWNDFAAKTEIGLVLDCFRRIEIGLRIFFCPGEERRGNGLKKIFVQEERREKGSWTGNNLFN